MLRQDWKLERNAFHSFDRIQRWTKLVTSEERREGAYKARRGRGEEKEDGG